MFDKMSAKIFLKKIHNAAIPNTSEDEEHFNSFKIGQKFETIPWSERNYEFHKKLFALLNIVTSRNMRWKNPYILLKAIQFDIGSVDIIRDINDQIKTMPKSIAFKNMSEIEFTTLFNDIVNFMLANLDVLVPGMSEYQYRSYVERVLLFV